MKALKKLWSKITYPLIALSVLRDEERRVSYDERKRGRG
jgi:hypothetical protein